jgi:hypothetical protein
LTNMPFAEACRLMDYGADAELSHLFGALIAGARRRHVQYADGSSKNASPLADLKERLYQACRKRRRRLTAAEYKRFSAMEQK